MDAADIAFNQLAVSSTRSLWTSDIGRAGRPQPGRLRPIRFRYELLSQGSVRFGQPVFFST